MQQAKLFLRYVDEIVRTVKGDFEKVLRAAKLVHPILQFTIETPNTNGNWPCWIYKLVLTKTVKLPVGSIRNQQIQEPY